MPRFHTPSKADSRTSTWEAVLPLRAPSAQRRSATKPRPAGFSASIIPLNVARCAACLTVAHLDHDPGNNAPDNLARLCQTHHWMYDAGLYPIEAIRLLQEHWQTVRGVPSHKARMKDAGAKAALTRKRKAAARKAVATRKSKAEGD